MLNIGLIGCGRIGKMHAETVVSRIPDARLAAVCDVSEEDVYKRQVQRIKD